MSKQVFPGLVQVPPSDRLIFRRRLLRLAFFIIAVIWGVSAISAWFSPSNKSQDCQTAIGPGTAPDVLEKCGQPGQSAAVAPSPPPQSESPVSEVVPNATLAKSDGPKPLPAPPKPIPTTEAKHAAAQHNTAQVAKAIPSAPSSPVRNPAIPTAATPKKQEPPVIQTTRTPPPSQNQEIRAAKEVSPKVTLVESNSPKPVPALENKRATTQHTTAQAPKASPPVSSAPAAPAHNPLVPTAAPPPKQEPPVPQTTQTRPSSSNPDIRAAEQGDMFAQYRLGRFYAESGGSDTSESIRWYRKALDGLRREAEAGNGKAMHVLGVMYAFGRGVTKDKEQARRWLTQATEHNVAAARPILASLETHRSADPNH
jgi:hypothetical protein